MMIKKVIEVKEIENIRIKYKNNNEEIKKLEESIKVEEANITIEEIEKKIRNLIKIDNELKTNKKILENYKEENKYLLEHKFNKECKECIKNREIHEKMNYMNKIKEISEMIDETIDVRVIKV